MRTRNTYVALLLALGAGTALTVVSCTSDTTAPRATAAAPDPRITQQKVVDLRSKYGWTGKYHTDGLAYVYAQLAKSGKKMKGREDACRIATKAIREFHKSARKGEIPTGMIGAAFNNGACIPGSDVAPIRGILLTGSGIGTPRQELSAAAGGYLDRLGAVPDNSTSASEYVSQVTAIEFEAAANLSESEAGAVAAVASVALSSETYWNQNLDSWSELPGALPLAYARDVGSARQSVGNAPADPRYWHYDWWRRPAVVGFRRIVGADVLAGGRTAFLAWVAGPVAVEAVAASALYGSASTAILHFF